MSFRIGRLIDGPWGVGPVLRGAIAVALISSLLLACERERPREEPPPRLVVPIRKPAPPTPAPPAKGTLERQTVALPTGNEGPRAGETREQSETRYPASQPGPPPLPQPSLPPAPEKGVYRVKRGETLIDIAGRGEVYGDPLRWPALFRLNMERLNSAGNPKRIPMTPLQEGMSIRFVRPEEAKENLKRLGNRRWVVNVLSSQEPERIYGPAIALAQRGYHVYLTKGTVKGQAWLRLRVGFFGSREEAETAGGEIRSKIPPLQAWVLRIGEAELEAFGGY